MPFRGKLPRGRQPEVPDPGQRVSLLGQNGEWHGGFVAVSGPLSDERHGVMVRVAEEGELLSARQGGRQPVAMSWPLDELRIER